MDYLTALVELELLGYRIVPVEPDRFAVGPIGITREQAKAMVGNTTGSIIHRWDDKEHLWITTRFRHPRAKYTRPASEPGGNMGPFKTFEEAVVAMLRSLQDDPEKGGPI